MSEKIHEMTLVGDNVFELQLPGLTKGFRLVYIPGRNPGDKLDLINPNSGKPEAIFVSVGAEAGPTIVWKGGDLLFRLTCSRVPSQTPQIAVPG